MNSAVKPNKEMQQGSWLVHQWVVAGIVSSAARFIPVPFVDDVVRDQCRGFVVSRTLASHNRSASLDDLKSYYSTSGGFFTGFVKTIAMAPLKIALFPIRKTVAIVTSVRGVPLEVMYTVLLGRTLDRLLRADAIKLDADTAKAMGIAFEETFAGMDFRVIRAALADSLSGVSGLKSAALSAAKQVADWKSGEHANLAVDESIDSGANHVQEVLDRPETLELFAEFDRRFNLALKQRSK